MLITRVLKVNKEFELPLGSTWFQTVGIPERIFFKYRQQKHAKLSSKSLI